MRINFGPAWRVVVCKKKFQTAEQAGPASCETKHDLEFWTQDDGVDFLKGQFWV